MCLYKNMYKHIRILLYKLAIATDPVFSIFSKFVYDQDLWTQFAFFKWTISYAIFRLPQ